MQYLKNLLKQNKFSIMTQENFSLNSTQQVLTAIQAIAFSSEMSALLKEYYSFGDRKEFFWKMMYFAHNDLIPFELSRDFRALNVEIKLLFTMLIVLIDDLVDGQKHLGLVDYLFDVIENNRTREHINITLGNFELSYLNFTRKVFSKIVERIIQLPSCDQLQDVLYYDIEQTFNAIKYSLLMNNNEFLINQTENSIYAPHTIQGMINCTVDLMSIANLKKGEIGRIREIFWNAQKIARIANCVSTWQYELLHGDFSNTVIAYAVSHNIITSDLLQQDKKKAVDLIKRSNAVMDLKTEQDKCYREIEIQGETIKQLHYKNFIQQLKRLTHLYEISSDFYR
jgi:hypothetical protein